VVSELWCEKHDHFKRSCPWCEIEELENEIQRLRAALEDIRYQAGQSDHPAGLGILATINGALSTTTESKGGQP